MGGNCAGYCNGQDQMNAEGNNQFRQSFNRQDFNNQQHQDFEQKYGKSTHNSNPTMFLGSNDYTLSYGDKNKAMMGGTSERFDIRAEAEDQVDAYGRVTKGPITMKNGATYTGQWLNNMRDGYGTQLWPDGSRYEG